MGKKKNPTVHPIQSQMSSAAVSKRHAKARGDEEAALGYDRMLRALRIITVIETETADLPLTQAQYENLELHLRRRTVGYVAPEVSA
jgi:hypothetical protein